MALLSEFCRWLVTSMGSHACDGTVPIAVVAVGMLICRRYSCEMDVMDRHGLLVTRRVLE